MADALRPTYTSGPAALRADLEEAEAHGRAPHFNPQYYEGDCVRHGVVRTRVPVVTNPGVEFFLGGGRVVMAQGESRYPDLSLPRRTA